MLFPWYKKYPYQNDEVLNLDWVLKTIDNLVKEVADFVTLNSIKYADPIQWNITTQYEKNTLVIDPISGTAYLSTKPVPAGVGLNNTDYWTVVFTLDVLSANKNITLRDDANNMLATFESVVGDWLIWQSTLYVVTRNIEIGQAYVDEYNIERATVEYFIKLYIGNLQNYVDTKTGSLSNLSTTDKTNLVAAINEVLSTVNTLIGTLSNLNTTDKTSVVNAINEVLSNVGSLASLNTTNKTSVVNAINEVITYIGTLPSLVTAAKTNLVAAINEVVGYIGTLASLGTSDKTNLVSAINEVNLKVDNDNIYRQFFNNKKVVVVGDSISSNTTNPPNWTVPFQAIVENAGGTFVNVATDGASVLGFGNSPSSIPNDGHYYIVMLGTNDYQGQWSGDLLPAAVSNIAGRCIHAGSIAWFVSPIRFLSAGSTSETTGNISPLPAYRSVLETLFSNAGFKIISGLSAPSLNASTKSTYMSDGLHPDSAYRYYLSDFILKAMMSGTDSYTSYSEVYTQGTVSNGTGTITYKWHDSVVDVVVSLQNAVLSNGYTIVGTMSNKSPYTTQVRGLINPPYVPSLVQDNENRNYYVRYNMGNLELFPFAGAGTYTLAMEFTIPLFFANSFS